MGNALPVLKLLPGLLDSGLFFSGLGLIIERGVEKFLKQRVYATVPDTFEIPNNDSGLGCGELIKETASVFHSGGRSGFARQCHL